MVMYQIHVVCVNAISSYLADNSLHSFSVKPWNNPLELVSWTTHIIQYANDSFPADSRTRHCIPFVLARTSVVEVSLAFLVC